jgi:hypothetical protein
LWIASTAAVRKKIAHWPYDRAFSAAQIGYGVIGVLSRADGVLSVACRPMVVVDYHCKRAFAAFGDAGKLQV